MTREEVVAYAEKWIADFNRGDVEAVLESFAEDVVFLSPIAGEALQGKAGLRAYWLDAVAGIGRIEFTLGDVVWDSATRRLIVLYQADLGQRSMRAMELFVFDSEGVVIEGEAMYGLARK